MAVFLYAVESPESKRQYPRRFKMFLDSLGLKDQVKDFLEKAAENNLIQCYVHIRDFLGCITFMIP